MIDLSHITSRLLTGGGTIDAADVATLQAHYVTHVIDCQEKEDNFAALKAVKISYLSNPTEDDGYHKTVEWFERSLDFALPAIICPHVRIYAHCAAGRNRGPSTIYVIMRALGWTPGSAMAEIHLMRPVTWTGGIAYAADADLAITALGYE